MVRPGIALYGAYPASRSREIVSLRPAMSLRTRVIQVRELPAGSTIGYGRTFRLEQPARIATLPVGYADGLLRSLSNRGQVLIRGHRHPVVGRVSMNLVNVRAAEGLPVQVGDEAVLLGGQGKETITGEQMAEWAGTIAYEVFTGLGASSRQNQITYHGLGPEPTE
jgi:alanine racemase